MGIIKAYNCGEYSESIIAIYDDTLLGSASDGLVFTGKRFLYGKSSTRLEFKYQDIASVEFREDIEIDKNGKEKRKPFVHIVSSGEEYKIEGLILSLDYQKFADFLNTIIGEFDSYSEQDQLKAIAEIDEGVKIAYIKILANMAFSDDQKIDEKEFMEILTMMTKLELLDESRVECRAYIAGSKAEDFETVDSLIAELKTHADPSFHNHIMSSLAKDLININSLGTDFITKDFEFLNLNKHLLGLNEGELDFLVDAVKNEYKIINEELDNKAIEKGLKEIASKAAAAGVPLGAVYLSGSVIGMSAAGMTSGLATLGMGGLFGLSSMATGIGTVAILGVVTYRGAKHLMGLNEKDRFTTRAIMIQEALKLSQKTISLIIKDINLLTKEFNDLATSHGTIYENCKELEKRTRQLALYIQAISRADEKSNRFENYSARMKCPQQIDEPRLQMLTKEPIKNRLYGFIMDIYDLDTLELKQDAPTNHLEKAGQILESLGYYEVSSATVSKATEKVSAGVSKLTELLKK